jgi:hypothetical protein
MMTLMRVSALAMVLSLSACSSPTPDPEPRVEPAPVNEPTAETGTETETEAGAEAGAGAGAEVPSAVNDPAVFNFEGFGPAKFGVDEEQVRMAWGRPLEAGVPAEGATCYRLFMAPKPEGGQGISFMFEDGGFVRYDVDVPLHVAPGDLRVGDSMQDVLDAFPGGVETEPHKYVERAFIMIVPPEDGGEGRLVLETDAAGIVTAWRIGVPPQVHYVEGCG